MIKIAIFTKMIRHKFFRYSLSNYKDIKVIYSLVEKSDVKKTIKTLKKNEINLQKTTSD